MRYRPQQTPAETSTAATGTEPKIPWRTIGLAFAAGVALLQAFRPASVPVFVSYDHDHDLKYRDLLRAWNANPKFKFTFDLTSPVVPIGSDDEATIKRALTPKLKAADVLLVVVGAHTARSRWIQWEVERALDDDISLPIAAVKLERHYRSPPALKSVGAVWGTGFTQETVTRILREAQQRGRE